jgi:hypothetical protein
MSDEDVGYKRPPASGRFKPGISGNPKGRPKRQPSPLAEIIQEVLTAPISYRHKGRLRTKPRQVLLFKGIVDRALAGDLDAAEELIRQLKRVYRTGHAGVERIEILDWLPPELGETGQQGSEEQAGRGPDAGDGDAAPIPGIQPGNTSA